MCVQHTAISHPYKVTEHLVRNQPVRSMLFLVQIDISLYPSTWRLGWFLFFCQKPFLLFFKKSLFLISITSYVMCIFFLSQLKHNIQSNKSFVYLTDPSFCTLSFHNKNSHKIWKIIFLLLIISEFISSITLKL